MLELSDYRRDLSLWHETDPGVARAAAGAAGDPSVDVAIVGAGFTGLWTAYYLQAADPTLRIAVVESEIAGFGASGRNGGWCSALFPVSATALRREVRPDAAHRASTRRCAARSTRSCGWSRPRASTPTWRWAARSSWPAREPQLGTRPRGGRRVRRVRPRHCLARRRPRPEPGSPRPRSLGADVHPALRRDPPGQARARRWPTASSSAARRSSSRRRATGLEPRPGRDAQRRRPGRRRSSARPRATRRNCPDSSAPSSPVYSLIIATEPLPDSTWAEIGLAERETFSDGRHLIIYGQRTADGRMVFGGRGAPYHLGSRIDAGLRPRPAGVRRPATHPGRAVPGPARRQDHPPLGRPARHRPRLARLGRAARTGSAGPAATSATACRRRTWPAGRSPTSSPDVRSPLTELPWVGHRLAGLGTRAPALAGRERRAARDDLGRPRRGSATAVLAGGRRREPGAGPMTPSDPDHPAAREGQHRPGRTRRLLDDVHIGHFGVVIDDGIRSSSRPRSSATATASWRTARPDRRWMRALAAGAPTSLAVTSFDGLVDRPVGVRVVDALPQRGAVRTCCSVVENATGRWT